MTSAMRMSRMSRSPHVVCGAVAWPCRGDVAARSRGRCVVVTGVEAGSPMAVSSTEIMESHWMTVEHQAAVVTVVDDQAPGAGTPCQRAIEVEAAHIAVELPCAEHHAEVAVAHIPPRAEQVVLSVHIEEVIEVDFVYSLILFFRQIELVGHLVAQKQSLFSGGFVWHCCGGDGYRHHHCHEHYLFHILSFFVVEFIVSFLFSVGKGRQKTGLLKRK